LGSLLALNNRVVALAESNIVDKSKSKVSREAGGEQGKINNDGVGRNFLANSKIW